MRKIYPELIGLSKRERRAQFKDLQKKAKANEKKRSFITKIFFIFVFVLVVGGFGYFWLTAKPVDQNGSANSGLEQTSSLKIGSKAPSFSLPSAEGKTVTLADYKGKNVLLYFQEGLMCQPCWKQIGALEAQIDSFEKIDTQIVAIGVDSASDWQPILQSERINTIPVLIDDRREMSRSYGVLSMSSQMHSDRPGHTFILVNKEGKVAWIADYPTMRVSNAEILDSVSEALKRNV